jgi:cytochrome c-type biogenesis protein
VETGEIAVLTALWLGILTSISPCPMATNIAAVSFVARQVARPRTVLLAGVLYTFGRMLAYLVLGIVGVWSLLSVVEVSSFLQGPLPRLLGPVLILAGVLMFLAPRLRIKGTGFGASLQSRADRWGLGGAVLLGAVFALSFCPLSAALFFGSLIPLATQQQSPVVLPALYGLGTGIPVLVFAAVLASGAGRLAKAFDRLGSIERWSRWITGAVFIAVGVYETLRVTLHIL